MKENVRQFLTIPPQVRPDFLRETVKRNHVSLLVACLIILVVECWNLARVLIFSQTGLGSVNNRIYFAFYCALLVVGVVWLVARRPLQRAALVVQWRAQYAMTVGMLLWHACVNAYDLYRVPDQDVMVFTTALLALTIFIQMPALHSVVCYGLGYGGFRLMAAAQLGGGAIVNLTVVFLVGLAISLIQAHHTVVRLMQQQEITQINAQLQQMVKKDPLTGLLNKPALAQWVQEALDRPEGAEGVTLFLLDLDNFKGINDTYGHPVGDYVLMASALKMRAVFPTGAGLGRIGGDEFAAALTGRLLPEQALALGERLVRELESLCWQSNPLPTGGSVGICQCRGGEWTHQDLYWAADSALYQAKQAGKSCCRLCCLEAEQQGVGVPGQGVEEEGA